MKKRVIAFVVCFLVLASVLCVSVFAQGLNDPSKFALGGFLYDTQNYFPQLAEFSESYGPYMRLNNGFFFVGDDLNNLTQVGYDWNWDYTLWRYNDTVQYWSIIDKNAETTVGHEHFRVYYDSAQNKFIAVSRPSGNVVASGRYFLVAPRISYDDSGYYSAGKNQINYEFVFSTTRVQYLNDVLTSAYYENGYRAGESDNAELAEVIPTLAYSVVEAPVNVFTSMLDFEIWGFSVKNLALGILSIAVVGAIVVFIAKVK